MTESAYLGEQLRVAVGELVRATRSVDLLSANQAAALGHLERLGPQTIAQLAAACRIRHQSMTSIVQQLISRGEVASTAHPTDGRALLLTLTPIGLIVITRDRNNRAAWLTSAIDELLDDDERHRLSSAVELMKRLTRAEHASSVDPVNRSPDQATRPRVEDS